MPAPTDLTGLAGIAVALAATVLLLPGLRTLSRMRRAALLAGVGVVVLVPFGTLPVAAGLRGVTGDLSITALVLLGSALGRALTGWPPAERGARLVLLAAISVAALALYPMALGVGMFDPYRLGYGSPWLLSGLFAVALAAWLGRLHLIATCLALGVLAWALRWYESTNLWDYLLDPLVACYALGALAVRGAGRLRAVAARARSRYLP